MSTTIKYKGETVTSIEGGQIATLHLKDAKLTDDLVIEAGTGGTGGGAEYNIAYGDTEPTGTSKLWIKTSAPEAMQIKLNASVVGSEDMVIGVGTLPTAASAIASAVVGTKVYLFGGGGSSNLNTINVFDTETNTIQTLSTTLPSAVWGIASAVVGTKVYLFGGGGSSDLNTINVFDTETNTIQTLSTTLPSETYGIASAVVGTKVYLFGGYAGSGKLNTINVFNTETNTIQTLSTTLPSAVCNIASAVVGTKVYLFGGAGSGNLNTINVFDTETNTIQTLSMTLPSATQKIASAVVGTKVYLFGGYAGSGNLNTINVFDTETNTIQTLSTTLPSAAQSIASEVVGTKVYLFGGGGSTKLATINVFVALAELATNNMLIVAGNSKNFFNLLPNMEIGVNDVFLGNADGYGERVKAALYKNGAWAEI